jgi:hypothetical protein
MQEIKYTVHSMPAWRDQADFLIQAIIEDGQVLHVEQLWARQANDREFVICCIPFYVYNLALGDRVATNGHPILGEHYVLSNRIERSGHFTFRVWLQNEELRLSFPSWLQQNGYSSEWQYSTGSLVAIDAVEASQAQTLADSLHAMEKQGLLLYETGESEQDQA